MLTAPGAGCNLFKRQLARKLLLQIGTAHVKRRQDPDDVIAVGSSFPDAITALKLVKQGGINVKGSTPWGVQLVRDLFECEILIIKQ